MVEIRSTCVSRNQQEQHFAPLWYFCCFVLSSVARTQNRKKTVRINNADETNLL